MASSEQLKALIKSHISRDDGHFLSVAMQVAAHEAKVGHGKLAEELREMIDAAKSRIGQDATGKLIAIGSAAKPRGELANLLTVSHPANQLQTNFNVWSWSSGNWRVSRSMGSHRAASYCLWGRRVHARP